MLSHLSMNLSLLPWAVCVFSWQPLALSNWWKGILHIWTLSAFPAALASWIWEGNWLLLDGAPWFVTFADVRCRHPTPAVSATSWSQTRGWAGWFGVTQLLLFIFLWHVSFLYLGCSDERGVTLGGWQLPELLCLAWKLLQVASSEKVEFMCRQLQIDEMPGSCCGTCLTPSFKLMEVAWAIKVASSFRLYPLVLSCLPVHPHQHPALHCAVWQAP